MDYTRHISEVFLYVHILYLVCVSGAERVIVSVRPPSLSMWMETGVHGVHGACAVDRVAQEHASGRENVTTPRKPLLSVISNTP